MSKRRLKIVASLLLAGLVACLFPLSWAQEGKVRGKALFDQLCAKCHTLADGRTRARKHGRGAVLKRHLKAMAARAGRERLFIGEEEDLTALLLGERRVMPAALEPGKKLFSTKCGKCHRLDLVARAHKRLKTAAGWQTLVKQERLRPGSGFTEKEGAHIARYLAWRYPPPSKDQERRNLEGAIKKKCSACHSFSIKDLQPRLPADWDITIEVMRNLNPFLLGVDEARRYGRYFKAQHLLKPATKKALSRENVRILFREKCFRCHSLTLARTPGEYFVDWADEVERMRLKSPFFYTAEEGRQIAAFLDSE